MRCATLNSMVGLCFLAFTFGNGLSPTFAQAYRPLSHNGTFSDGLSGWVASGANVTVTDQGHQSLAGYDASGPIGGGNKLEISGAGYAWQVVSLTPGARYHLLNCQAHQEVLPFSTPRWSGYGIIYYDAWWGVIDTFEKQIVNPPNDFGDYYFLPSSLGVRVPADAVYAIIWASNDDSSSKSAFDALTLMEYSKAAGDLSPGVNMTWTRPSAVYDTLGNFHLLSGFQFWHMQDCIDVGSGYLGVVDQACSISQEIDVIPGTAYVVSCQAQESRPTTIVAANYGVDFYDAMWNRLSGGYRRIAIDLYSEYTFTVPVGTAHTIAWVWVDSLDSRYQRLSPTALHVQEVQTANHN